MILDSTGIGTKRPEEERYSRSVSETNQRQWFKPK